MSAEASPESIAERPWRRSFWSLIATQFLSAFIDSAYKNLVVFLILAMGLSHAQRDSLVFWVSVLLAAPYILFSMTGGYFADRFSKRSVIIGLKLFEVSLLILGLVGLARGDLYLQLAAVFLLNTQGALFGPSKYGLLPEVLPEKRLSWGNGVLELGTFAAIITGLGAGGLLAVRFHGAQHWSGLVLMGASVLGLLASLGIGRVPAANPARRFQVNFLAEVYSELRGIRGDRPLLLAVIGNAYFWFLAALLQIIILIYGAETLRIGATDNAYMQAAIAIGIGLGSLAAGYLSGNKIEYGLIPLGAAGMTAFGAALAFEGHTFRTALLLLWLLGFFAGFFAVPLLAMIQHRPQLDRKGGVIAAANWMSFVGIILAAGVYWLFTAGAPTVLGTTGMSPPRLFLVASLITLAGTIYVVWLLPDSLLRLVFWFLTRTLYKIRIEGRDNIPEKGGALFACNHMSMVDAMLLIASTDRFIRFLMFQDSYDHPLVKPFARILHVIPISSQLRPRDLIHSLREATQSIESGEVVGIFPEGQMTRIGQMLPFRRGMERIMKGVDAPIIPVHLDGVWGSIFSFERGRFFWKLPRRIPYPVTVTFGRPLASTTTALEVRRVIQEMGTKAFHNRARQMRPLHRSFVRNARRVPFRLAMADGHTPRVSFGTALMRTIFLARRLRRIWQGQEMVGLLLPPSVGGALVNLAATLLGKVPVNLNYTVSAETLASCARQCNLKTIVSSRAFLEHISLKLPMEPALLEDLVAKPGFGEKLISFFMAWSFPIPLLERALGRERPGKLDDLATIIFSSGSTGDPKGVMLSHYNVAANIEQVGQVFALDSEDRMLGILPFFHSFGFMGTLWLPLKLGLGVVYHPSPLDARVIGGLVGKYAVTFLLATPTFLQAYMRRCTPEDFGSLQFVLAGAEKLPERIALGFEDVFGIRPLEGYGCTECSPVVAVNTRDYRAPGFRQVGAKRGRIGHPLPGVSVRILDPDTGQPLDINQPGLLWVSGPNVMLGYLGRPEKTAEVLRDGWYNTGDIATVDEDGFLRVTDRLSRFSKIGGEMVPHLMIEEKLQELAGAVEQVFAVTSVPDEKKGERLAVLHTLPEEKLQEVLAKLAESDLPALWRPRPQQFFRVETLPYLGTGKLDLRRMREVALASAGTPEAPASQS
ncbi:MAG: acyl-[ACP]--phospholipid O-acyltransferase [Acidobacteriota bacterium]|nr:acyl-[ACP]--phospholipid O-acyltransferase [Acidobacteriota bacterium]